jgi:hypothetical protein
VERECCYEAFCRAGEGELMCQKDDCWRKNGRHLWLFIWVIEEMKWSVVCRSTKGRGGEAGGGSGCGQ